MHGLILRLWELFQGVANLWCGFCLTVPRVDLLKNTEMNSFCLLSLFELDTLLIVKLDSPSGLTVNTRFSLLASIPTTCN